MIKFVHLVHSLALENGGVAEAVKRLNDELNNIGVHSRMSDNPSEIINHDEIIIAHGLWQWPSILAWKNHRMNNSKYLLFPHGMLDPWFRKAYPWKHIKKQIYWWYKQARILRNATAVCFTTDEEKNLARNTFIPYKCKENVTGLGVANPIGKIDEEGIFFWKLFQFFGAQNFYYILVVSIQKRNRFINQFLFENGTKGR